MEILCQHLQGMYMPKTLHIESVGIHLLQFVEVKGPGDRLSQKQILWLDKLIHWGCSVEVCKIKCNVT